MAGKSNVTGLDTGTVLPSEQLELALGFEKVLAGDTAPPAAPEAPEVTTPPVEPVAPVTEAPVETVPEALLSTVDETAGVVEEVTEGEPEVFGPPDPRFTKPSMAQEAKGESGPSTYWSAFEAQSDPDAAGSSSAMPNGDIEGRAARLAEDVASGAIYLGGTTAAADQDNKLNSLLNNTNALDNGNNDSGKPRMTPLFAKVLTYVTEDALSQTSFGKNEDGQFDPMDQVTDDQLMGTGAFSKADGNRRLGREIHRAHQRIINKQQKKPTDAYTDLSPDDAFLLGDIAKELYYQGMNRQYGENVFLNRQTPDSTVKGEQVVFEVTDTGASLLRQGNTLRKKLLPKDHVRPLKTPPVDGMLGGEIGRITRSITQRVFVPGDAVNAAELNEAMRNYSQVAHVVDPQRLKILLATAMAALSSSSNPYRSINHIGEDKMNEFVARQKIAQSQGRRIIPDPNDSMRAIEDDLAQALYGICLDRKGANYLTFYLQGATGRIAVQQTNFDPTTKKSVRFVTRSATPTMINKGSRFDKALRQMYAMALVKDADALVPSAREKALTSAEESLYNKGVRLRTALAAISDSQVEKVADAIAAGMPLSDPNFPQMPTLQLDPNNESDATLMAEIQKKGEDGQAYIDGLIDFANYKEAMDANEGAGRPYHTYFNAYIDGKTNGLAGNGMQLGDMDTAKRTGVIRSGTSPFFLDDDQDIRDVLENTLIRLSANEEYKAFSRSGWPEVYEIAKIVYGNRGLNKTTSMTFGYGKNVEGFKQDIEEFMLIMQGEGTPEGQRLNELMSIFDSKNSSKGDLIDAIHSHYDNALREVLGENTMPSRNIMRGAAFLHSIANELFTINGPTGSKLNMGGMMSTGAAIGKATSIKIFVNKKGKYNIWYGSGENASLSNLALRPFQDKEGRVYQTVEHAYQTLKSGKFDEKTYNKPWKAGVKFKGKRVNEEISIGLMTKLIQASLDQNPDAMTALQETRGKEITHNEDNTIWNKEFPRILMQIRDGSPFYQKQTTPKSQVYGEEATSAAPKFRTDPITGEQTTEVGGTSWGAAIPIPVQSIDAATVARLASDKGGYWKDIKRKSQNPKQQPYVFPIYDAFKMDAASYDAVLKDVNKAWVDINFEWSYLKQTQNSLKQLRQSLNEKFKNPTQVLQGNEKAMMNYLFSNYITKSGNPVLNINNKLGQVMYPVPKGDDIFGEVKSLQSDMKKHGFTKFTVIGGGGNEIINPNTELTVEDLKIFIDALERKINLDRRLNSLISKTDGLRSKLESKIIANMNSNNPDLAVLQYYSH